MQSNTLPEPHQVWRHIKTNGVYVIVNVGQVKYRNTTWEKSVSYVKDSESDGTVYTRDYETFMRKFKPIVWTQEEIDQANQKAKEMAGKLGFIDE